MEFQILEHRIKKVRTAQIRANPSIQEATAHYEHLKEPAQSVHEYAGQRCALASLIGIFCPNGRIKAKLLFPFMPVLIGMMLDVAR